jgi:hypothetical protein
MTAPSDAALLAQCGRAFDELDPVPEDALDDARAALQNRWRMLTVQQPYAFAIAEGFKAVEVRTRPVRTWRGPLLIHAARSADRNAALVRYSRDAASRLDELGGRCNFWDAHTRCPSRVARAPHPTLALGAVVAVARLADCHPADGCCGPWGAYPGGWHWTLTAVQPLSVPVACRGGLGLRRPMADVLDAVLRQIAEVASCPAA